MNQCFLASVPKRHMKVLIRLRKYTVGFVHSQFAYTGHFLQGEFHKQLVYLHTAALWNQLEICGVGIVHVHDILHLTIYVWQIIMLRKVENPEIKSELIHRSIVYYATTHMRKKNICNEARSPYLYFLMLS